MLGRNTEDVLEPERVELMGERLAHGRIDLVHGERYWFAKLAEDRGDPVRPGDLGPAVDHEEDVLRVFERDSRLSEDLARDQFGIVRHDTACVNEFEAPVAMLGRAIDAVSGDAWFVADDRSALTGDRVEQRGLADVRPADDDDRWQVFALRHSVS